MVYREFFSSFKKAQEFESKLKQMGVLHTFDMNIDGSLYIITYKNDKKVTK